MTERADILNSWEASIEERLSKPQEHTEINKVPQDVFDEDVKRTFTDPYVDVLQ